MKDIGQVISKFLGNLDQADIAERAGLYESHISDLMTGKRKGDKTTFRTLERIAKALGVSVSVFSDEDLSSESRDYGKHQAFIEQVIEIFESDDKVSIAALQSNIIAFHDAMISKQNVNNLEHRLAQLEKQKPRDFKKEPNRG